MRLKNPKHENLSEFVGRLIVLRIYTANDVTFTVTGRLKYVESDHHESGGFLNIGEAHLPTNSVVSADSAHGDMFHWHYTSQPTHDPVAGTYQDYEDARR